MQTASDSSGYRLQGVSSAPRAARVAVDRLKGSLPAPVHARLRLLASELVTSAITCRASTVEPVVQLEIDVDDEAVRLRVERVRNRDEPMRDQLGRSPQWTLALLDEMADAWGVVHDECGRHLRSWAELRVGG